MTEDEMVGWHHQLNAYELGQTQEMVRTGKPVMLQSMGLRRVGHYLVTEQLSCVTSVKSQNVVSPESLVWTWT